MKKFVVFLFVLGFTSSLFSQVVKTEQLSEVVVTAVNYKYLNQTDNSEAAVPVKLLQRKVAAYDVKDSDFYQDDFGYYNISFYIPEGKIVAAYDANGKILRTIERFKDIQLPVAVRASIEKRFPNWEIVGDVYRVNFSDKKGAKKSFKVKLQNGDKVMRVKLTEDGEYL